MFKKIPLLFLMMIIALSACGTLNVAVERRPLPGIPGVDATSTPPDITGPSPTFTLPVQPLNTSSTPLVSVTPTPVPATNNSEIYQVITRPNPKNDLLTDVYIQNISTQEEKLFITLDNVNTGNYHVGEYHNGNLYIIRRMGYPDENWSDELWRYDILGNGKMLFSKKGLDFRVAPNENYAAVAYQSTEDNTNKVAFISENGEVVQDINVDPTGY